MKNIKAYLSTAVISVVIPFLYYSTKCGIPFTLFAITGLILWITYYYIVVNNTDTKAKRIKFSFIIQLIIVIPFISIPLAIEFSHPPKLPDDRIGHRAGFEWILPFITTLEPFLNHIWCIFIHTLFVKIPMAIYNKLKSKFA